MAVSFSCSGGMGPLATIVYKCLASLISEKFGQLQHDFVLVEMQVKFLTLMLGSYLLTGFQVFLPSLQVC